VPGAPPAPWARAPGVSARAKTKQSAKVAAIQTLERGSLKRLFSALKPGSIIIISRFDFIYSIIGEKQSFS
jgi:hypothetical protein